LPKRLLRIKPKHELALGLPPTPAWLLDNAKIAAGVKATLKKESNADSYIRILDYVAHNSRGVQKSVPFLF